MREWAADGSARYNELRKDPNGEFASTCAAPRATDAALQVVSPRAALPRSVCARGQLVSVWSSPHESREPPTVPHLSLRCLARSYVDLIRLRIPPASFLEVKVTTPCEGFQYERVPGRHTGVFTNCVCHRRSEPRRRARAEQEPHLVANRAISVEEIRRKFQDGEQHEEAKSGIRQQKHPRRRIVVEQPVKPVRDETPFITNFTRFLP